MLLHARSAAVLLRLGQCREELPPLSAGHGLRAGGRNSELATQGTGQPAIANVCCPTCLRNVRMHPPAHSDWTRQRPLLVWRALRRGRGKIAARHRLAQAAARNCRQGPAETAGSWMVGSAVLCARCGVREACLLSLHLANSGSFQQVRNAPRAQLVDTSHPRRVCIALFDIIAFCRPYHLCLARAPHAGCKDTPDKGVLELQARPLGRCQQQ